MWTAAVGVDGSAEAERAVRWAAELARQRGGGIVAVHAYEVAGGLDPRLAREVAGRAVEHAETVLHRATDGLDRRGITVEHQVRAVDEGNVAAALLDAAREADLLVTGSRGIGGFFGLLMGSVSMQVVLHAPCPVAVVPGKERVPHLEASGGQVVVGIDGSEHAARALDWSLREVKHGGGALALVYAGRDLREREGEETLEQARALVPGETEVEALPLIGDPAEVLVERSEHARLTVVGSRGRGGFRGLLLGSVGLQLAQHARSPVVVVRGA